VDLVLGLSMTSADVRWVLVEGTTAEGATIRRDAVGFDTLDDVIAAVGENRIHAVGVTWANEAESASTLLDGLADRGLDNVITVSEEEAADALAIGIADRGGYSEVAVCIVDRDDALVALVDADGVTTERVGPTADDVLAVLDRSDGRPDAIFVLGSADGIASIASSFDGAAAPVITAAEADLALARGAALASAQAVQHPGDAARPVALAVENRRVDVGSGRRGRRVRRLDIRRAGHESDPWHGFDCCPTGYRSHSRGAGPHSRRPIGPTGCAETGSGCAGGTASVRRATRCADDRRGRGARTASGPGDRATSGASARLCAARARTQLRSACPAAATAASRPHHRTHPDHQPVPPAGPVRLATST